MSKLELKHVIPYVDYDLEVLFDGVICELEGIDLYSDKKPLIVERISCRLENVKLLLRPLSDLRREIDVNGEKFSPLEVIGEEINDFCEFDFVTDWHERGGDFIDYLNEFIDFKGKKRHLNFLPFGFVQKLFEWKFDVFGLIDKNLAIDINTLK